MPLPFILAAAGIVLVGGAIGAIAAMSDDDDEVKQERKRRDAAQNDERRRQSEQERRKRRKSILGDALGELSEIADRHRAVGRVVATGITYKLLKTAVSEWSTDSKVDFRKARDMLMPRNGRLRIHDSNYQESQAINGEVRVLSDLSSAVSEHVSAIEDKARLPEGEQRIRHLERNLPAVDESSDDLRRQVHKAVDDFLRQASVDINSPARIVACGLLCAGKSSLLNALTDHFAPEHFPTGGGRTTRDCSKIHAQFGEDTCLLVDTPGIDSDVMDDTVAKAEVRTADHLLFVHTLATGELHSAEAAFLEDLARQDAEYDAATRGLTVVLTHQESYEDVADRLSGTILAMIESITGKQVPYFRTAAPVYTKGVSEDKRMLVEFSGIPALRGHCREVASDRDKVLGGRRRRLNLLADSLLRAIDSCAADWKRRRQRLSQGRKQREAAFDADLERLLSNVAERMKAL